MNALIIRLRQTNIYLLSEEKQANSSLICVIMINMYKTHVAELMRSLHHSQKASSKARQSQSIWKFWDMRWDWLIVNEMHRKMTQTFKIINLFKIMNKKSRKWFVTDTFFKRSFFQIMTWMNTLMIDSIVNQHEWVWKEKEAHRVNLKYCIYQNLKDMNKIHMKIIEIQETNSQIIQKYIKQLKTVCDTLWLRRDINQLMFFNSFLTDVKSNEHQDIDCSLSLRFNKLVNFSVMIIIN